MKMSVSRLVTVMVSAVFLLLMLVTPAPATPLECSGGECAVEKGGFADMDDGSDIDKRLSKFVRIGKGYSSSFVRIGRPSSFVRIGKSTGDDVSDFEEPEKRKAQFMRIGKGANRFMRIGKKSVDSDKRASRFMRIGKSMEDEEDMMDKRGHAFVRIGKIPSAAFVRIGRVPLLDRLMKKPSSNFLRIGRMGQSSFVRIGKKSSGPEQDQDQEEFSV